MLGNFSFGDYFKADAIAFAHELLTKNLAIDPKRLVYTVHHSDDEARALWKKVAGVDDSPRHRARATRTTSGPWARSARAARAARSTSTRATTFPAPRPRPASPCQGPACDCDRWIEIWNLVFMQFEQLRRSHATAAAQAVGRHRHGPRAPVRGHRRLPLQLRDRPPAPAHRRGGEADRQGLRRRPTTRPARWRSSMRAIADHARAAAFLIADGVFPEKTGREYVLRRIMRRAIYHGWLLGIDKPFLAGLAGRVIDELGDIYAELVERRKPDRRGHRPRGEALPRDPRPRHAHPRRGGRQAWPARSFPARSPSSSTTPSASPWI